MKPHDNILMLLVLGGASCLLSPAIASSACNFQTLVNLRKEWAADDEPCHQKLSFDLWLLMKADGAAASPDAQHVLAECLNLPVVNHVELSVDEAWEHVPANGDCGFVVHKGKSAAAFAYKNAADLEAMCSDAGVSKASRIRAGHRHSNMRGASRAAPESRRRLKTSISEAGEAHQVDELIAGLQDLGCANTMGNGQVYCVMSDTYNMLGNDVQLVESGDLPPDVEVVKEDLNGFGGLPTDEGSAMMELAYDIAPSASYKFNTAKLGYDVYAEDVTALSTTHGCDVIVDDIAYFKDPAFRDGALSKAIDSAVEDKNILYFNAGGNDGRAVRFNFTMECTTEVEVDLTSPQCTTGVATHVFDDTAEGIARYLKPYELSHDAESTLLLHWDDDVGDTKGAASVLMLLWNHASGKPVFESSSVETDTGYPSGVLTTPATAGQYSVSVHIVGERTETAVGMLLVGMGGPDSGMFDGASDASMFGNVCARKAISVAAINHEDANGGAGGAFSDPETSSVEAFSSRGGCAVRNDAGVLEGRMKPVTTAATGLATSSEGFDEFYGTSAAAPVAAAIATLVRAACAPEKVVGYKEMMEMLTDDAYTIEYPADDEFTPGEMWGVYGGYGIISAAQMLEWVRVNCAQACPGKGPTPTVPTPTAQPTVATHPTPAEPAPPVTSPVDDDESDDGNPRLPTVTASGYDDRSSDDGGCGKDGCLPGLAYDGITEDEESRWSCKEDIVPGRDNCELHFKFEEPVTITHLEVSFWKWDTRTRRLKVSVNGDTLGSFESSSKAELTSYAIDTHRVKKISLEAVGLDKDEWIDLLEVAFYPRS